MTILKKINAFYFALCLMLVPFATATAGALDGAATNLGNVNKNGNAGATAPLPSLIGGLISVLLGSLGIVFVIFIVQAGIMYMTAAGDPAKVDKAKKMITQAIVGIIIVVGAYSISKFVIDQISSSSQSASPQQKLDNAINK